MNFFGYQDSARKRSGWLIALFVIAVVAIVAAVDLVLVVVLGGIIAEDGTWQPVTRGLIESNADLLIGGALATAGVIFLASLYRTASLRAGGGQIARELGATPAEADPDDPLRRRLRNVVEEIAIASGVPVPEVYVLEQELGINAFAAGYSPSDAAIAVTRGALEHLDRDELQGVIAHEFSHVLNGDMRLNIRLIGVLFGILALTVIGRRILLHTRHIGRARGRGAAAVLVIAFAVMVIGSIGQFFGRWIKAALSRQREYLADASAVQFTRDTQGIGDALKKIAAHRHGSKIVADTEEVGHMLFGAGKRLLLFKTHPPIEQRIRRVDPGFRIEELEPLAARMLQEETERVQRAKELARRQATGGDGEPAHAGGGLFDVGGLIGEIGQPAWERLLMAATLAGAIPLNLRRAAQSPDWAPQVLFYTLLDNDRELREHQLLMIAERMGGDHEQGVRALLDSGGPPADAQRLPLLELAFPALKRRPPELVTKVLATVKDLVRADDRVDVFEYLLARGVAQHLWESQNPQAARLAGRAKLASMEPEAGRVLAIVAAHGHADAPSAAAAWRAGLDELGIDPAAEMPPVTDWAAALDADLPRLDRLKPAEKERLVRALTSTVTHDGKLEPAELELLRAVCDLVHVPLPLLGPRQPGLRS